MQGLFRNRIATNRYIAPLGALPLLVARAALAADAPCTAGDTSLSCRLTGLLHWLEAAAFFLALVLVALIAVTIHLFRKNRPSRKEGR